MKSALWRLCLIALCVCGTASAESVSSWGRARLAAGKDLVVVVEYNAVAVDQAAGDARRRRGLPHDDAAILAQRSRGYADLKNRVAREAGGTDALRVLDYAHLPMAVWRLKSLGALERLEANPAVRRVHDNDLLHPVSVSDLPFISQPQAAAEGAQGAGTTIAVIDGGLGTNYTAYADFGTCTAVNTPASTCRVVFNVDVYPGASTETVHGTNVSAIALGVAPGAKLAMFDVFNGASASSVDIINAIDTSIADQALYGIAAINMSLGDGTTHATTCPTSVYAAPVTAAANAGISTVVAAGNSGAKTGLDEPACVPGVISVGAVYDAGYGTVGWVATADSGGTCFDASAADLVTCFSQSASYLSLLAPGTFVNAPNAAFQESGTSQATPHVAGSVAVLRARYPAESLAETLERLQLSPVKDADLASGIATPRLNLLAAVNQGTAVSVSGTGPVTSTVGATGAYSFTVSNAGPLVATHEVLTDQLPAGATLVTIPSGCTVAGSTVTCTLGTLAVGATATVNLNVKWSVAGAVYDNASVRGDQIDSAPSASQSAGIGTPPPVNASDGPLPPWAYAALGLSLWLIGRARLRQPHRSALPTVLQ